MLATFPINEKASGQFTGILTQNDGITPLPLALLSTLTLTLYAIKADGTVVAINGRDLQNVLNTNNVTVDVNGNLTWTVQVGDTTLVETIPFERHIARFEWTWPGGVGRDEATLVVQRLTVVP